MSLSEPRKWNQRSSAAFSQSRQIETMFRLLFESSTDAILIVDPKKQSFLECNSAAVDMWRGSTRDWFLSRTLAEISAEQQIDGSNAAKKLDEVTAAALIHGTQKLEWLARRPSGEVFPVEVVFTPVECEGDTLLITFARDISERKKEETRIQRLNEDLESRVRERTIELVNANEKLKTEIKERRRKEKVQRALYQISEAIHTTEDLDSLFEQIHKTIQELMDARNFYIAFHNEATDLVHFPYFVDEIDIKPAPLKLTSGLTSYVLRTGKALLVNSETKIQKLQSGTRVLSDGTKEIEYEETGSPAAVWLGAPLTIRGKTFGIIAVQNYHNQQVYGNEEKQILTFVAEQIALVIERKKAEEALRDSEEKHRALFEASSQGVILHDEVQMLELNEAAVRILGYNSAEELIGKHPAETSAPIQPNGERAEVLAKQHIEDCIREGHTRFDWLAQNAKGEQKQIEVILTRVHMAGRQIIQAVINDISERKAAEAALRQANRELTTLIDTLPGYAFYKDADGRYRLGNENLCQAVELTKESLVGKTDFDLFPRDVAEKFRNDDLRLIAAGEPLFINEERMIVRGRNILVETQKAPVKNDDGEVIGVIGMGFDITKRKNAEQELLKALARETELSQMKTNFVSTVSHEFRTPLGIIMSSSQILADYFDQMEPPERKEHLQSIIKNTRQMATLMEEVLLLSRVDAGKIACQPALLELKCVTRRIREEMLAATENRCPINLSLEPENLEAKLDEKLLRHILNNLLLNAVKYSPPENEVELRVSEENGQICFQVRDRGIGIPAADQQWLFDAFHRGRNVGDRPGTGLGLSIVKRCVDLHGGTIHISSSVGEGTTVTVRLAAN
jgi:PAS domain S-box-containing protein